MKYSLLTLAKINLSTLKNEGVIIKRHTNVKLLLKTPETKTEKFP